MATDTQDPTREAIDAEHERLREEERIDDGPQDVHGGDDSVQIGVDASGQFELIVGGKAPTTTKVRLLGGAIEVEPPEGGFRKGGRYALRVETVCRKVEFTDEVDDKTSQVTGCAKGHGLRITGARLIEVSA